MSESTDFPPLTVGQLIKRLQDLEMPDLPVAIRLDTAHHGNGLVSVAEGSLRHVFTVGGAAKPLAIRVELEGRTDV